MPKAYRSVTLALAHGTGRCRLCKDRRVLPAATAAFRSSAHSTAETAMAESTPAATVEETTDGWLLTVTADSADAAAGRYDLMTSISLPQLDAEVVVETYVQAKQSWWEDKATVYSTG